MSLDVDLLLDRRRLKSRLTLWRSLAVIAVVAALLTGLHAAGIGGPGRHIARLQVTGVISEDRKLLKLIADAAKDPKIPALIVAINSPGGSVSGGEALHHALSLFAEKKPVVAVMGGLAASAGYMIAMPANRVFARESTITGSIGVILETGELSGLLGKLGVTADAITSGPLKDQPSYTKPLSPQGRDVLHGLVMDMYDQFVGIVAAGRHMTPDAVRALADGRAYTGRQALKLGLVDAIGDEQDARAWLASEKGVADTTPVADLVPPATLAERMVTDELSPMFQLAWKTLLSQRLMLDGPWALWQH